MRNVRVCYQLRVRDITHSYGHDGRFEDVLYQLCDKSSSSDFVSKEIILRQKYIEYIYKTNPLYPPHYTLSSDLNFNLQVHF